MMRAVRSITNDIKMIEEDSMDLHKTKQLAHVLYVLSERTNHEKALDEEDPDEAKQTLTGMIEATDGLI